MRQGCLLVALALNPVKLHELLGCYGWISWHGRNTQRLVFSPWPSCVEGFLILGLTLACWSSMHCQDGWAGML